MRSKYMIWINFFGFLWIKVYNSTVNSNTVILSYLRKGIEYFYQFAKLYSYTLKTIIVLLWHYDNVFKVYILVLLMLSQ